LGAFSAASPRGAALTPVLQSIASPAVRGRQQGHSMPVVAVVNRKGGSGKSTLATHLAAHCANAGARVMLGDVDRQQSTRAWLRQRAATGGERAGIASWPVDPRNFARPPAEADLVVLDTPGGLAGLDLARVVMYADAILMPVGPSIFDRESAADCLAELRRLPRVAADRCRIGVIGMRLDARTEGAATVRTWAQAQGLPLITVLRESDAYVRCIEDGLTLFDLPPHEAAEELAQWKPLLLWLRPLLRAVTPAPTVDELVRPPAAPIALRERPAAVTPRPPAPVAHPFGRNTVLPAARAPLGATATAETTATAATGRPLTRLLDALPIPRFLQRSQ
jgi:chromosome partitioning protein